MSESDDMLPIDPNMYSSRKPSNKNLNRDVNIIKQAPLSIPPRNHTSYSQELYDQHEQDKLRGSELKKPKFSEMEEQQEDELSEMLEDKIANIVKKQLEPINKRIFDLEQLQDKQRLKIEELASEIISKQDLNYKKLNEKLKIIYENQKSLDEGLRRFREQ